MGPTPHARGRRAQSRFFLGEESRAQSAPFTVRFAPGLLGLLSYLKVGRPPTSKVARSRPSHAPHPTLEGAGRKVDFSWRGKSGSVRAIHCALCAGSARAAQLSRSASLRPQKSRDLALYTPHTPHARGRRAQSRLFLERKVGLSPRHSLCALRRVC